jgi:hypothetical protein
MSNDTNFQPREVRVIAAQLISELDRLRRRGVRPLGMSVRNNCCYTVSLEWPAAKQTEFPVVNHERRF